MADRFEYDRDRYGAGREYGGERDRLRHEDRWRRETRDERGMLERAGDEVRSWFGDDEAVRRRQRDERHEVRGGAGGRGWTRGREFDRGDESEPGRGAGRGYGTERGYAAGEEGGRSSRAFTSDRESSEVRHGRERPEWGWERERERTPLAGAKPP